MRCLRVPLRVLCCVAVAGCAGVSPRPEAASADSLPVRQRSAAEDTELAAAIDRAIEAVVRRRYDDAEREARAALALDPRAARARSVLGMVLLQRASLADPPDLHLTNRGETETLLAEQLAPGDAFVGWMRAVFLAEAGHMSAGAAAAEAALARTTNAPPQERAALLGVAGTYRYELGEERAALPHLQAYVGLRPDDAAASFRIGNCLLRKAAVPQGPKGLEVAMIDADAAARAFARCAELAPGDEDAALAVGAATMRAAELAGEKRDPAAREQRLGEAIAIFARVAERFPASAEPLFRIGVVAEANGDEAAAWAAYSSALERDARHLGSLLNLAALLDAGDTQAEAAALLQRALQADAELGGLTPDERKRIERRLRPAPRHP